MSDKIKFHKAGIFSLSLLVAPSVPSVAEADWHRASLSIQADPPMTPYEKDDRENRRIINATLPDGAIGLATGLEHVPLENIDKEVILVLGIRTSPEETDREAEEMAKLLKRPVLPLAVYSTTDTLKTTFSKLDNVVLENLGLENCNSCEEIAEELGSTVAEVTGTLADALSAAYHDMTPSSMSFERAIRNLANDIIIRIREDRMRPIVAHSKGTVIVNKAFELARKELTSNPEKVGLDKKKIEERLAKAQVVLCGSFVSPDEIKISGTVKVINMKDDPVASVAGWNRWFQSEGQDFTFASHNFSRSYRQKAAEQILKFD